MIRNIITAYRGVRPLIFIMLIILTVSSLNAESDRHGRRGDYLTLKIAVLGPGDPLYIWWGHIGLIVEDQLSGRSIFYDYGLFSFENEQFFLNFAFGRMLYSCGASPTSMNLEHVKLKNRDIILYTLDISSEKKEEVWRFAERNILPENRDYYYHLFDDNCSSRIRNIIDLAVDGQLSRYGSQPGRYTLSEHFRRFTWFSPVIEWFLMVLAGESLDKEITVWDEMFLPVEVGKQIENFKYIDSEGVEKSLVSEIEIYNKAIDRPGIRDVPRKQWAYNLSVGLLLAGFIIYLQMKESRTRRIALGITNSLLGLILGTIGTIACFMSFFTNHDYTWNNLNILFINPIYFTFIPMGIISAVGKGNRGKFGSDRLLSIIWTITFTMSLFSIFLNIFPGIQQDNRIVLSVFMPTSFVSSLYYRWIYGKLKKEKISNS